MLKAGRAMHAALSLVDLVVELVDARAPRATRNPVLRENLAGKPFLVVANKADLADAPVSRQWEAWFAERGERVFFLNSHQIGNVAGLTGLWRDLVLQARAARGATRPLLRPVRLMIVGIPNIGKSTLVNRLHQRRKAEVGPKPGVTRQNQWLSLPNGIELLDTPGVLWPRMADKCHELLLTLLGNIRDEVVDTTMVAEYLCLRVRELQLGLRWQALGLDAIPEDPAGILAALARRRGFLRPGGEPDVDKAAVALIKEFRDGRLGRMSLEVP